MSEPAIKKRLRAAAERAVQILDGQGFQAFTIPGNPFHVVAVKGRKVRFIRIILDRITGNDRRLVGRFAPDSKVSREFWVRQRGDHNFKIVPLP